MDLLQYAPPDSMDSYLFFIGAVVMFVLMILILMMFNFKGFNETFGNEFLITAPILVILTILIGEIISLKQNPNDSILFSNFSIDPNKLFIYVSIAILIVGIIGLISLLGVSGIFNVSGIFKGSGIFKDNPPENNVSALINFLIIFIFIFAAIKIYKSYVKNDETKFYSSKLKEAFEERTKYTAIIVALVMGVSTLYFVNPFGIMTNYGGPIIFLTLFTGLIMLAMILIYQNVLDNPNKATTTEPNDFIPSFMKKLLYFIAASGISFGFIYWILLLTGIFDFETTSTRSWTSLLFNLVLLIIILGVLFRLLNVSEFIENHHFIRLIVNTIFYIPCLFSYVFYYISNKFSGVIGKGRTGSTITMSFKDFTMTPPKPFEIKMLLFSLSLYGILFSAYYANKYFESQYLKQGGTILINNPVETDKLTNVTTFQLLSDDNKFNYQYALSFWFYLDAFPPSTNSSYSKLVSLLSYGGNPAIKYSSANNTLYITVKNTGANATESSDNATESNDNATESNDIDIEDINNENISEYKKHKKDMSDKKNIAESIEKVKLMTFGKELDSDGSQIIYKHPDVLLQKWNHVLINYSGGTLDVFYNGKLVKTAIEVVPYIKNDMLTVGTENGVSGNIANLSYFNEPLDVMAINILYEEMKNKSVPSIPHNDQKLIPMTKENWDTAKKIIP